MRRMLVALYKGSVPDDVFDTFKENRREINASAYVTLTDEDNYGLNPPIGMKSTIERGDCTRDKLAKKPLTDEITVEK